MAEILKNNISIGTTAIKNLIVTNASKIQQPVKYVKQFDEYTNADITYDTLERMEYKDLEVDFCFYDEIPVEGGTFSPHIGYHQAKIYIGYSGCRYLNDENNKYIPLQPLYNYVGEWTQGMFVKYNDVILIGGNYYRCINRQGTSESPLQGYYKTNNDEILHYNDGGYVLLNGVNGDFRNVFPEGTIADKGEWEEGVYVYYGETVYLDGKIYKCINPNGSRECPVGRYTDYSGTPLRYSTEMGTGYVLNGENNEDFVVIQEDITEGAEITFSGTHVDSNGNITIPSVGGISKPRTKVDTVIITIKLNGKTITKSVDVYQSANAVEKTVYTTPILKGKFNYDVFGQTASIQSPIEIPTFKQYKYTTYTSGTITEEEITTGGVFKFVKVYGPAFSLNENNGIITTQDNPITHDYHGTIEVYVTANGKTSNRIRTSVVQLGMGIKQWTDGQTYYPNDIVVMGMSGNKTRRFTPKVTTQNPPLWVFTDDEGTRYKYEDGGYVLTGNRNGDDYTEIGF